MWLILLDLLCVLFMMLPHWHQKQMRCNSHYKCLNRPFKCCWPVKMKLPVKIKSGCWEFKKLTDSATKTCAYGSQKDQSYKMWHFYDGTWSTTLTKDGWIYYKYRAVGLLLHVTHRFINMMMMMISLFIYRLIKS